MNDIHNLVIVPDIRPLLDVERIKLQFVWLLEHEDDLEQVAGLGRTPDNQFVIAFLFRPRSPCMANDVLRFLQTDAMPRNVGQIPVIPRERQIHLFIV